MKFVKHALFLPNKICHRLVVLLDSFVLILLAVHKLAESPLFFKNCFLSVMYPESNKELYDIHILP